MPSGRCRSIGDAFGEAVAINGDRVVIGAPGHEGPGGENSGAVYVFDGATGLQLMKLVPSDGAAHDRFGSSSRYEDRGGHPAI